MSRTHGLALFRTLDGNASVDTVNWFLRLHTPDTVSWFCCGLCSVKHAYRTCRRGSGQTADGLLSAITKLTQNHLFLTIPLSRCIPLRTPCINAYDGVYHMLISCVCTKQLRLSTELIEAQLPPLSAIFMLAQRWAVWRVY